MRLLSLFAALSCSAALLPAGTIHLKTGDIRTDHASAGWDERAPRQLKPGRRHLMVEFSVPVNQALLASLTAQGAVVNSSLGQTALMVSVPDTFDLRRAGAVWAGPLAVNDKVSPVARQGVFYEAWLVDFHSDVSAQDADAIVVAAGFRSIPNRRLLPHERLVRGSSEALPRLAEWDEVAYVYPASKDLVDGQLVVACGGALSQGQATAQFLKVGNGWTPNGPNFLTLNYVFTTLPTNLPADQVRSEILRAMRQWSAIANVQFAEGQDPAAPWTIAIEFGTAVNNDPASFDPSGIVLAHTYYPAPPNAEPIAGDLHFDPYENWHIGATADIYTVALHELGHALGLAHTDNPGDVMYPYYRFGAPLSADDIAGAQSLYGAPASSAGTGSSGGSASTLPVPALSLVVTAPAPGSVTSDPTVSVSGVVLNPVGTPVVSWQSSHGDSGQAAGGQTWSIANVTLDPGQNTISLSVTDSSQRTASAVVQIQSTPVSAGSGSSGRSSSGSATGGTGSNGTATGVSAPVVTVTSPQSGYSTGLSAVTISGAATDPSGIASVSWETNAGATGTASGTTTWTASGVPLLPGENTIVIRARNTSGIMRWTSLQIQRD